MKQGTVRANGIEFAYVEEGSGPLVLLLHGYPDIATTWSEIMPAIAGAGFRAVAPWTRGYPPTEIPDGGYYDSGTLATDARELIRALGAERAHVVGHDWGAATTYYLCAAFPEAVGRAVTLAIPHPRALAQTLLKPDQARRVFHFWFFQMPGLPEAAIPADDFAFIEYLWGIWSPGHDDVTHVRAVKEMMRTPGAVSSTIAYYRAMFRPENQDPATAPAREALGRPITVPTMAVLGARDITRGETANAMKEFFTADLRVEVLPECGHFLHRERPAEVARLILEWLAAG